MIEALDALGFLFCHASSSTRPSQAGEMATAKLVLAADDDRSGDASHRASCTGGRRPLSAAIVVFSKRVGSDRRCRLAPNSRFFLQGCSLFNLVKSDVHGARGHYLFVNRAIPSLLTGQTIWPLNENGVNIERPREIASIFSGLPRRVERASDSS